MVKTDGNATDTSPCAYDVDESAALTLRLVTVKRRMDVLR